MQLIEILEYRRAHGSMGEFVFHARLRSYLEALGVDVTVDGFDGGVGNIFVDIPTYNGEKSSMVFTSHIDTCHSAPGKYVKGKWQADTDAVDHIKQLVMLDDLDCYRLTEPKHGDVLGADDGVGVWIMLNMIDHRVPGLYCFFRGEERGGLGSSWSALNDPSRYEDRLKAVAFDRPNDFEIITHQGGDKGASDEFANALATEFHKLGLKKMTPSDAGVYTDTKELFDLIPECINIGVGYASQHSSAEWLDSLHAVELMEASKRLDWESLPAVREAGDRGVTGFYTFGGWHRPVRRKIELELEDLFELDHFSLYCELEDDLEHGAKLLSDALDEITRLRGLLVEHGLIDEPVKKQSVRGSLSGRLS